MHKKKVQLKGCSNKTVDKKKCNRRDSVDKVFAESSLVVQWQCLSATERNGSDRRAMRNRQLAPATFHTVFFTCFVSDDELVTLTHQNLFIMLMYPTSNPPSYFYLLS